MGWDDDDGKKIRIKTAAGRKRQHVTGAAEKEQKRRRFDTSTLRTRTHGMWPPEPQHK
jgi:hypothetical protein